MTFSAWLLVEISFVHIKLTSWQSCHLSFSSYKSGTKQMLLDFFWHWTFFGHSLFKAKERSLVNPSRPAVGMLMYLSKPINWVICKYIPKDSVAVVITGRWIGDFSGKMVEGWAEGLLSVCTYPQPIKRWQPRQWAHSWADDSCLEFLAIITKKEYFQSKKVYKFINIYSPQEYSKITVL